MSSRRWMARWAVYALFASCAPALNWHEGAVDFDSQSGTIKPLVWLVFSVFLAYSLFCTLCKKLFRTSGKIAELLWGRQIGANLYPGLLIALLIIFSNEGVITALLWLLPVLAVANLAVLLYVALHVDSRVPVFVS